ncbi:arginine-tRNA-protein transferase 1 [Myriangium duriaei CBS 260.36]|uniref:Arginyl-tRNA--protein transferase 1 n=1 Tax=Myriangium duriaei CBS 260.36 TaxID=1168546 RepID=A0A9P4J7Z9_9PEZI|nr:arginine-tRNA-protein transferase 1 [Myriangium duriaei CBS 260.36]
MQRSRLVPYGYQSGDCGYCKNNETSAAYYAKSSYMTVETYQALVDRGWRRSGDLLYKPDVLRACCPHYTIRLPAASFKPSRDQRQAINRWNAHVLGDKYAKEVAKKYPRSKEEKKQKNQRFDLVESVQEAEARHLKPVEPAHRFEVTLEPDDFSEEKFQLYRNYQSQVHGDIESEITRTGFKRFLCTSPLKRRKDSVEGREKLLGSYHQCYRLDGRLIAMGVLDLLPHAVSGVYLLYHSDFGKWNFGKLSALREIALVIEGKYNYYYMGYYIHNCVKMRYKGDYKPQLVLDPMTYHWNPLEDVKAHLDQEKFVSLDVAAASTPEDKSMDVDEFAGPDGTTWRYKSASEAAASGESLFIIRMPGVPTASELSHEVDLDQIHVTFGQGMTFQTNMLSSWEDDTDITHMTLRGAIAELAACVGQEVAESMAVDFSR